MRFQKLDKEKKIIYNISMKIFSENLYFITTEAEAFCEIIAYRSKSGQLNIGDNALDLLGVDGEERGFLIRNLFLGGDNPIIITSDSGALVFNRKMLYSTGICCIVQPENPADAVCQVYLDGGICHAVMSPKAKAMAESADARDSAKAYLDISRIERMLSVFGDRESVLEGDVERTATLVCECIGCPIELSGQVMDCHSFAQRGMIYAGSIYAISVLLMAFLAKIISDGRTLILQQNKDSVRFCIKTGSSFVDTGRLTDYILRVARQRDMEACLNISEDISLDICPFFLDVGLTGVKNPARLKGE